MENSKNITLRSFDMTCLEEIREARRIKGESANKHFLDEIEEVLKKGSSTNEWEKLEGEDILGTVWCQEIGTLRFKHTEHRFTWLYIGSLGPAIATHGHMEPVHGGKNFKSLSEWYILPDGEMPYCWRGAKHHLDNNFERPIYVLSIKAGSKAAVYTE